MELAAPLTTKLPTTKMNATTKAIIDRLENKPILQPGDISAAYGMSTASAIIADIKLGKLAASCVGGKYYISREAAARYIAANEVMPSEGTIKK